MKYKKVNLEQKIIAGVKAKTGNLLPSMQDDIGNTWKELFSRMKDIKNVCFNGSYGIYCEYEGDMNAPYTFFAGLEVSEKNEDMDNFVIPAGGYLKFDIKGFKNIGPLWQQIWRMDIDRNYIADFEEYGEMNENPDEQEISVYIGVK